MLFDSGCCFFKRLFGQVPLTINKYGPLWGPASRFALIHRVLFSYDWKNAAVQLTRLLEPRLAYAAFVLILEALKTGGFASLLTKKDRPVSLKAFVVYSDHDIVVPCDGVIRVMYFTKVILLFVQFDVNLREVVCPQEWLLVGVIGYVEEARLFVEASG